MRSASRVRDSIMSTSDKICKDGESKLSEDCVEDVEGMLQKLSTADNKEDTSICANIF